MDIPTVTVHYAQTLDGRIATRTGHARWISCPETLRFAHQLRAEHGAVMVGIGTILADNPQLTVRHVPGRSPIRTVADSTLRIPDDAHVLDGRVPTVITVTRRAPTARRHMLEERGVTVLEVAEDAGGRLDLHDLLRRLGSTGISSLLIEGGRGLITSALQEGIVDRLVICVAPKIIGSGIDAVGDLAITDMNDAITFEHTDITAMGKDIVFDGVVTRRLVSSRPCG